MQITWTTVPRLHYKAFVLERVWVQLTLSLSAVLTPYPSQPVGPAARPLLQASSFKGLTGELTSFKHATSFVAAIARKK
jgi:hypothetical protein